MIYENNDFKFFKEFKVNIDAKKNNEQVIIKLPEYFDYFYDENIKRIKEYVFCKKFDYIILGFKSSVNTAVNFCKMLEEIEIYIKKNCERYKVVYIIGISKGGIINCLLYNKLIENNNINKIKFVNISTPYKGTIFADPKALKKRLEERKIPFKKNIYNTYIKIYDGNFPDQMIQENSEILKEVKYNNKIINFVAKATFISFLKDLFSLNIESALLYLIDKVLKIKGDGIVPIDSQMRNYKKDIKIKATHKTSYFVAIKKIVK